MNRRRAAVVTLALLALIRFDSTGLAADSESPLGLWENEDATFQIFESNGKLGATFTILIPQNEVRRSSG
jgi:hypothetical protein